MHKVWRYLLVCLSSLAIPTALASTAGGLGLEPDLWQSTEPSTYRLIEAVAVRDAPGGKVAAHWPRGTLLTSNKAAGNWLKVTGHFPDERWAPATREWWIHRDALADVRHPTTLASLPRPAARRGVARTFRLVQPADLIDAEGEAHAHWEEGSLLTSNMSAGDWIRVTGHFPDGQWQPMREARWLHQRAVLDVTKPEIPTIPRSAGHSRHIVINKNTFELAVVERSPEGERSVFTTTVGLGMDRCLPEEEGGRCYYTEPGEYQVRWKIYEPDGIEWCIPPSMEQEARYAEDVAQGKRCFPGALGSFALNIGKTYAIHGTNSPDRSLGRRVSHGCVRAANDAMEQIYRYMEVGDTVLIVE